jgi:hypothetical protein
MKRTTSLLLLLAALALLAGCNYAKKIVYVEIANRSGQPMRNVELKYPSGSFGLAELRGDQSHERMVPAGSPCAFELNFENSGKKFSQKADFGAQCPLRVGFDVGEGMKISSRVVKP